MRHPILDIVLFPKIDSIKVGGAYNTFLLTTGYVVTVRVVSGAWDRYFAEAKLDRHKLARSVLLRVNAEKTPKFICLANVRHVEVERGVNIGGRGRGRFDEVTLTCGKVIEGDRGLRAVEEMLYPDMWGVR